MIFKISATIGRKKFHYITPTLVRFNHAALNLEEHAKRISNLRKDMDEMEKRLSLLEEQGQAPSKTAEEVTTQVDPTDY